MEHISGETMVLYADLRERLEAFEAMRTVASLPGEFTTKNIKGKTYHYFQATLAGGRVQIYVGPDNEIVRVLIAEHKAAKEHAHADEQLIERLSAWRGEADNQNMKQVTTAPENDRIHRSAVSRNKNVT